MSMHTHLGEMPLHNDGHERGFQHLHQCVRGVVAGDGEGVAIGHVGEGMLCPLVHALQGGCLSRRPGVAPQLAAQQFPAVRGEERGREGEREGR